MPTLVRYLNCMRDSKPQRCVQQHKSLKVKRNARNEDEQGCEAFKQTFANNLFKISFKYTQCMLSNRKFSFNALIVPIYHEFCVF